MTCLRFLFICRKKKSVGHSFGLLQRCYIGDGVSFGSRTIIIPFFSLLAFHEFKIHRFTKTAAHLLSAPIDVNQVRCCWCIHRVFCFAFSFNVHLCSLFSTSFGVPNFAQKAINLLPYFGHVSADCMCIHFKLLSKEVAGGGGEVFGSGHCLERKCNVMCQLIVFRLYST